MSRGSWIARNWFPAFLALACAGLAFQVIALTRQKAELLEVLAREREGRREAQPISPGEIWAPFSLRASDGRVEPVGFRPENGSRGRTLVCVFAQACTICPENYVKWEELAALVPAGTRVLAIGIDGPAQAGDALPQGVPVYSLADASQVPLAKLTAVPITILFDGAGVVEWVHRGRLDQAPLEDLVARLLQ
jgi:hypothetical protein